MSYCDFCAQRMEDDIHRIYHDTRYGFPIEDDTELFKRLVLEINQAGLSWEIILKKEQAFDLAFEQFEIEKVAAYCQEDIDRLLGDSGIIRNRLKINAAIYNANKILELRKSSGSFKNWLDHHHPKSAAEWNKLFKKTFKFVGPDIVNEFLMSTGYLAGAHHESCPIYEEVLAKTPKWKEL